MKPVLPSAPDRPATTPAALLRARYPMPAPAADAHDNAAPADPKPAAAEVALDPLEARILLCHVLGWPRTALITRSDEALPDAQVQRFRELARRRLAGEPIAQLVGAREFFGLSLTVTPDVLIPRPETELLVELALAACETLPRPCLLDLGTGSGAIAIALAATRPDARVTATDRSPAALAVARGNGARLLPANRAGGPIDWREGDWFEALKAHAPATGPKRFDVIVSNPPYIRRDDPHLRQGDLRFEPRAALTDEADGLSALRTLIAQAPAFLAPGGELWLEHGYDQSADVAALLSARGFQAVRSVADLAGIARATGARFGDRAKDN
jgi:release factor glutamine methyltransferase